MDGVELGVSEIQGSADSRWVHRNIDGDRPLRSPWRDAELPLIRKYTTNHHYEEINLIQELADRGHLMSIGERLTMPVRFSQSIEDYIEPLAHRIKLENSNAM